MRKFSKLEGGNAVDSAARPTSWMANSQLSTKAGGSTAIARLLSQTQFVASEALLNQRMGIDVRLDSRVLGDD
jgi:hypothetical protein